MYSAGKKEELFFGQTNRRELLKEDVNYITIVFSSRTRWARKFAGSVNVTNHPSAVSA